MVTVGGVASHVTVSSVDVEAALLLPAGSCAAFAAMLAMTVPAVVMPLTAAFHVVGPPDNTTVFTPPAVPAMVTSAFVNVAGLTASLNTMVKLIGDALVGSAWAAAWLMVTVGATLSHATVLSVEVDAALLFPAGSCAAFAAMFAITVPEVVIPVTDAVHVILSDVDSATTFVPPAVPVIATSAFVNVAGAIADRKSVV